MFFPHALHHRKLRLALAASVLALLPVTTGPASAAVEIARTPWQVTGAVACSGGSCRFFFPLVATNRRLDLQFVSCFARGVDLEPSAFSLAIDDALGTGVRHFLVAFGRAINNTTHFEVSQPVVLSIAANHRPQIGFTELAGLTAVAGCTLSGELVFLQ